MRAVTEKEIRASFVNCSRGEAKRLSLPRDLDQRPWEDLDFLGWRDHTAQERAYLVVERGDGLVGVALRLTTARVGLRRNMCSVCLTTHPGRGVALMAAPKARGKGRDEGTVGLYLCADFACSLYIRGKKEPEPGGRFAEALTMEEQISRASANLGGFLDRVSA
ncbi:MULTISPECIES: FBP domain-containing protein [unclassified Nocardiopsis]|uniref:FBP domain-containing protein n=1 Tax=unclassified Nocardiopsis TaxID=2649073 RepID=UPI00135C58F9|nr:MULTISPECIES: FBP domain-containing protein [unclassified Nocardiopsis]